MKNNDSDSTYNQEYPQTPNSSFENVSRKDNFLCDTKYKVMNYYYTIHILVYSIDLHIKFY